MKTPFNKKLELEWISVNDKMPLDDSKWDCNIITRVFALIQGDIDLNDDPTIVLIAYEKDKGAKTGRWCWSDGELYPKVHAENIKYWCDIPNYERLK